MKNLLLTTVLMFFVLSSGFGQSAGENRKDSRKVAVLDVVDREGKISYGVKQRLRNTLSSAVTDMPGYEGDARVDVSQMKGGQDFRQTGAVDDALIKGIREATGASYVLVTEAVMMERDRLYVMAKLLDVKDAKLERTDNAQLSVTVDAIERVCRRFSASLLDSLPSVAKEVTKGDFTETVNGVSFEMVYVKGGTFMMGATSEQESDAEGDEKPVHQVTLAGYHIGKCEVTQGVWKAVMGSNPSYFQKGDDYPVESVSWEDIQMFLKKLNRLTGRRYALPTEAQWEYAARGGNKNGSMKYSGSSTIDGVAWHGDNSGMSTHPVGKKHPNALGIYDMSGNVYEWCSDWFGSYSGVSQTVPAGPSSDSSRVVRGGSWYNVAGYCRTSHRDCHIPAYRGTTLGFRLVVMP